MELNGLDQYWHSTILMIDNGTFVSSHRTRYFLSTETKKMKKRQPSTTDASDVIAYKQCMAFQEEEEEIDMA